MKIALYGRMGAGKDTAAEIINRNNPEMQIKRFAEPLYLAMDQVQLLFGLPRQKDRKFLQQTADWATSQNPDVFINWLSNHAPRDNVVIADLRRVDEYNYCKLAGYIMIKIVRDPGLIGVEQRAGTGDPHHHTEGALDGLGDDSWHYVIENNSSIPQFTQQVMNVMNDILVRESERQLWQHGGPDYTNSSFDLNSLVRGLH